MRFIDATATKRITRRKFGRTGPTIVIADRGDTISVWVSDTIHADKTTTRQIVWYPEGGGTGYGLTIDEFVIDTVEADASASIGYRPTFDREVTA